MVDHIHRGRLHIEAIPALRAPPREAPPGYDAMPLTHQWPQWSGAPVDKSTWRACHACGCSIPVRRDRIDQRGKRQYLETYSYVCPACHATHRGSVHDGVDRQQQCHGCKAPLGDHGEPCAACGLLRGWAVERCRHCGHHQAVCMPHLASMCDVFLLECYRCEQVTESSCIC